MPNMRHLTACVAVLVLGSGLAVLLSAVNVYLRDTQHLVEVLKARPALRGTAEAIHDFVDAVGGHETLSAFQG